MVVMMVVAAPCGRGETVVELYVVISSLVRFSAHRLKPGLGTDKS